MFGVLPALAVLLLVCGGGVVRSATAVAQVAGQDSFTAVAKQIRSVYRIAPSVATGVESRRAISRFGWVEAPDLARANAILVVVKTLGLRYPLNSSYDSLKDLSFAASLQLNINGEIVHVYLFTAGPGSLREIAHMSYPG